MGSLRAWKEACGVLLYNSPCYTSSSLANLLPPVWKQRPVKERSQIGNIQFNWIPGFRKSSAGQNYQCYLISLQSTWDDSMFPRVVEKRAMILMKTGFLHQSKSAETMHTVTGEALEATKITQRCQRVWVQEEALRMWPSPFQFLWEHFTPQTNVRV